MWWRNFAGSFAGQCVEQFMDSGPGGMHIEIRGERKVIHDIMDGDVGPDFNRALDRGPAPPDQVFPDAAWWIIGLTVSALVVLFMLRWFWVVTHSAKKLEEEYHNLIPRESSDKLQLRLQEAERELKRAREELRKRPTTKSVNYYSLVLEEINLLKKQIDEKE